MSTAPLRCLRTFWAVGGAPGALVRRDTELRERLERIVASAPDVGALADERSYASLLRSFDLNEMLATEVTERATPIDVPGGERARRAGSPASWGDVARSRSGPTAGARDEIAGASNVTPSILASAIHRAMPNVNPYVTTEKLDAGDDHEADPVERNRTRRAPAPGVVESPLWREVAPIALDASEERRAAVARILAAADPAVNPAVAGADAPVRGDAPPTRPAVSPSEQLAKTVQRAERRLAEQRSTTPSRVVQSDIPYRSGFNERAVKERDSETQRDDWIALDQTVSVEAPTMSRPRPAGMRGLAVTGGLRFAQDDAVGATVRATVRAPLFGLVPNVSADWPPSELDQLSSALDSAARSEGVELGELGA